MSWPAPPETRTVVIGDAGTAAGFAAAMALRRHWPERVRLVAMDINPRSLVTAALLADAFEQVPLSTAPAFADALAEILRRHQADTYMPVIDAEICVAAELREASRLPESVVALVPSTRSARVCADKFEAAKWMTSEGIPTPRTALATEYFASDTFFLKPRRGFGSKGTGVVSRADLARMVGPRPDEWIVQEPCSGPEVTVDAFRDPASRRVRAVGRQRLEVKAGVCTKARVFEEAALAELAHRIGDGLALAGGYCFQVMSSNRGWLVTDINPRLGAGTAISVAVGVDFFAATFAQAWRLDPWAFLGTLSSEHIVTRQYSEFVMS